MSRFAARSDRDGLRRTMANGVRQLFLLLVPAAVASAVLAEPIVRLLYERGTFVAADTEVVAEALFWFSFSLPFSGANLMFARTFFALQRPWTTTALAGGNLLVNAALALALYEPFGVAGIVIATGVATVAMALAQAFYLRRPLAGVEGAVTLAAVLRMCLAAAVLGVASYLVWWGADALLGRALWAQACALGAALGVGAGVYAVLLLALRVPEARQLRQLLRRRPASA
jgi:putative peptidoglycan lipid II flippase